MENTQNKIYEIEESALLNHAVKTQIDEENKEQEFNYGDQFDENNKEEDENQQLSNENMKRSSNQTNDIGQPYSQKYEATDAGQASLGVADLKDVHIDVKTGTTVKHMKNPPFHIKESFDFEPLYPP